MSNSATVSSYVTDNLGGYESVVLTLNSVQLRHTSGRNCEIIKGPLEIDAAELGRDQLLEQVDTMDCEAGPYNRLYVELDDDVVLRENAASGPLACKFVSYIDSSFPLPNRLACANGTCSLNITGAVNLIARNHEHIALDVDLKNFVVNPGPPCEVTLKVSPLHAGDKLAIGFRKRITGTVSNLDIGADTFTLTVWGHPFTVQYTGVTDQTGLEALLERAVDDGLRTSVRCETINMATTPPTCTAQTDATRPLKAITVKAKGTVSLLDTVAKTFTLNYGAGPTMLPVNYATADTLGKVMGTLDNGDTAGAALYGFDAFFFLARVVVVVE